MIDPARTIRDLTDRQRLPWRFHARRSGTAQAGRGPASPPGTVTHRRDHR